MNTLIKNYIIRFVIFSLLVKYTLIQISIVAGFLFFPLFIIACFIIMFILGIWQEFFNPNIDTLAMSIDCSIFFAEFLGIYLLNKICGLFKQLDKFNFPTSFIIVILSNCLLILFDKFIFSIFSLTNENELQYPHPLAIYMLIPAFLLYGFFGFLTKKFPVPFKKIGYWSSKEFWGGLVRKLLINN